MPDELLLSLLFLLIGLFAGGLVGWLAAKLRFQRDTFSQEDVDAQYVHRSLYQQLEQQSDAQREDLFELQEAYRLASEKAARLEQANLQLEDTLRHQKEESVQLQQRFQAEFENLANRLLEEKSRKFTVQNHQQLDQLLSPLRERIKTFEEGIEKRFVEETRDRISLKKEIEGLRALNQQLSEDANNLASALKGDNKAQGDWGEIQLELLLEKAGLQKNVHFQVQPTFRDENGKAKRPDFIINLPEDKTLIIDSKVSLKAYDRCFSTEDKQERERHLKAHIDSIRRHIRDLSSKNYTNLYQVHTPDYLLLYIPIEPAFALAVQQDPQLFVDALDANVVVVSNSTLLATMRTVSYIWKQEKQKSSVLEIARQSGMLYDKFVNFVDDLKGVGQRIQQAQHAYDDAMNKLVDSKKYGDTLVGRAERIRELGARTSRQLPEDIVEAARSSELEPPKSDDD
ncbi:MAG: DNA recombination protein RmuC [Phaeodactylibacter xiamenensis]|uniref:RmuC-domain-containing protein n=1 Tax=Phaeodactylibacter xiamenensis TaxID=1524460 RepID=A0A098S606_9BACT|nr:DNA recombination protein RmuC [Phaeodactylibacter xiamenensis]KGE86662.1 RmuC-domain-containing protein [Phaeodactylibacter xiamenensis]MCR9052512.1 DNA recombination protein RmuC [bacterium]